MKPLFSKLLAATLLAAFLCMPATAGAARAYRHHPRSLHRTKKARRHTRTHASSRHKHRPGHHPRKIHPDLKLPPATASDYCAGANLKPNQENLEKVRTATLCLVNGERVRLGRPPLVANAALANAALGHSLDMIAGDYFEHVSPGGQTPLIRIQASGFIPNNHVGYKLGENLAWGTLWYATPRSIVEAWMASPPHRANILNRGFRDTGIGVAAAVPSSLSDGQAGGIYTQDFGTIITG